MDNQYSALVMMVAVKLLVGRFLVRLTMLAVFIMMYILEMIKLATLHTGSV
jgi:hypothetical protein